MNQEWLSEIGAEWGFQHYGNDYLRIQQAKDEIEQEDQMHAQIEDISSDQNILLQSSQPSKQVNPPNNMFG